MADHSHGSIERHCDVLVLGATSDGLTAAISLARERRSVIVVDPGGPSSEDTSDLREAARRHGTEILAGRVVAVEPGNGRHHRAELVGGHRVVARRVLAATRPVDVAVDLPGVDGGSGDEAAARIRSSLAEEDRRSARPSAQQADWDHRYQGGQMWSGNPNGSLVDQVADLPPGRALDVGAGEGGDAIWLAERGWQVTANDISTRALERLAAEADRRGIALAVLTADANDEQPFEAAGFDLVSAQYASIPRTPDDRAARNLLEAVAPGGLLLVVSHDLAPMQGPVDTTVQSRPFDPDAYVRVDDFVALLSDDPGWTIELDEKRPRPPGAASTHHVDDLVLRARRALTG